MDELREMARAPVAIFDRFLGELQRVTRDKSISAPVGIERLKELQASMVREIEESLLKFRSKVGEVERRLHGILRPARPPLYDEIKQVTQRLQHLLDLAIRRDLATSIEHNVVHGSDSPESARFEIPYFFPGYLLPLPPPDPEPTP